MSFLCIKPYRNHCRSCRLRGFSAGELPTPKPSRQRVKTSWGVFEQAEAESPTETSPEPMEQENPCQEPTSNEQLSLILKIEKTLTAICSALATSENRH